MPGVSVLQDRIAKATYRSPFYQDRPIHLVSAGPVLVANSLYLGQQKRTLHIPDPGVEIMLVEPMISRLEKHSELESALQASVRDAVALLGGEFGDIQLRTEKGVLVIVGQAGLPRWFIESFSHIAPDAGTTCARAARSRKPVTIHDLREDPDFKPFVSLTSAARSRAAISSPLISSNDSCIGVVSVYFAFPHSPTQIEIETLETYCRKAADFFVAKMGSANPAETAERIQASLIQRLEPPEAARAHSNRL